jgi:hypothetical protein
MGFVTHHKLAFVVIGLAYGVISLLAAVFVAAFIRVGLACRGPKPVESIEDARKTVPEPTPGVVSPVGGSRQGK